MFSNHYRTPKTVFSIIKFGKFESLLFLYSGSSFSFLKCFHIALRAVFRLNIPEYHPKYSVVLGQVCSGSPSMSWCSSQTAAARGFPNYLQGCRAVTTHITASQPTKISIKFCIIWRGKEICLNLFFNP